MYTAAKAVKINAREGLVDLEIDHSHSILSSARAEQTRLIHHISFSPLNLMHLRVSMRKSFSNTPEKDHCGGFEATGHGSQESRSINLFNLMRLP